MWSQDEILATNRTYPFSSVNNEHTHGIIFLNDLEF